MQARINAHHLHPEHMKILNRVLSSKELPTRIDLIRRYSRSSIEALVAGGHLADAIARGHDCVMVTALTQRELDQLPPWQKHEEHLLQTRWSVGAPILSIAADLGRSGGDVVSHAWKLGLLRRTHWSTGYVEARNFRHMRCRLIDAERRGLRHDDNGKDILHRAEQRRFRNARRHLNASVRYCLPWSSEDLATLRECLKSDYSIAMISHQIEREPSDVAKKIVLNGRRLRKQFTEEEKSRLVGGFCSGLSLSEVAQLLPGRSKHSVNHMAKRLCPEAFQKSSVWSIADKRKLLMSYLSGVRGIALAELFPKRSKHAVRRYLYGLLHERDQDPFSPAELQIMIGAIKRGESVECISRWLARNPETISSKIKNNRIGWKGRPPALTPNDLKEVQRLRRSESLTNQEIGARFGLSPSTISRHLKRI
jgi:hypothetical protein